MQVHAARFDPSTFALGVARRLAPIAGAASTRAVLAVAALGLAAGCSDSPSAPDAGSDAINPCPAPELFYTGELVSWDSTPSMFRGVFDAAFTVEGEAARTDKTSPNGRFELCLANAPITQLSVETTASSMFRAGVAIAEAEVLRSVELISLRSFTPAQEAMFSTRITAGKAHVLVDIAGKQRAVTLPGATPTFVFDGNAWAAAGAGAAGRALFFANLEPAAAPTTASMSGAHAGGKRVPLVADRITFITVVGK